MVRPHVNWVGGPLSWRGGNSDAVAMEFPLSQDINQGLSQKVKLLTGSKLIGVYEQSKHGKKAGGGKG